MRTIPFDIDEPLYRSEPQREREELSADERYEMERDADERLRQLCLNLRAQEIALGFEMERDEQVRKAAQ